MSQRCERVLALVAAVSLLLAFPAPAAAVPPAALSAASSTASSAALAAPVVPCPRAKVPSQSPARPVHHQVGPVIGGEKLATPGLAVPAGALDLPATISAAAWVVADLETGDVIGACAPHRTSPPASVEKLLLTATVLPKLDPHQVVTITADDMNFEPGSSAVGLLVGGKYTVETLWMGLLLNSGNDAANVLARLGGGARGVAGTVADMNTTAKHLGALDTVAVTPSGLDGPGQVTSAYDLALIARADFSRPDFRRYTGARSAQIPPQPPRDKRGFQIQNDNQLLFNYPGAIGGKTGFTDVARHTYVGAATREGQTLVVTLLDGEHKPLPLWQQAAQLLDWGFAMGTGDPVGRLVEPGETDPKPTIAPTPAAAQVAAVGGNAGPWITGRGVGVIGAATMGLLLLAWAALLLVAWRRRRLAPAMVEPHEQPEPDILNR